MTIQYIYTIMNLKENIRLILKEERELISIRRNMDKFPKYVRSTYEWLRVKSFVDFDDFLERVIFSTIRDFVAAFSLSADKYHETIDKVSAVLRDIIIREYYDEIFEYYIEERNK